MPEDAKQKLDVRLVPAEGEPDAALLDDLVRLVKQGALTAPPQAERASTAGTFIAPPERTALENKIISSIDQASRASEADVAKRAEVAKQPDGEAKLAEEALAAAQGVVAAVQRAVIRGVTVRVPEDAK